MFGLSSRDALATRQQEWVRDISSAVRSQPSRRTENSRSTDVSNRSIISLVQESDDEVPLLRSKSVSQDDGPQLLKERQEILVKINELQQQLSLVVETQSSIQKVLTNLERVIKEQNTISDNEFTSFFNSESYAGVDNRCLLVDDQLSFVIEVFGEIKDKEVTLYPFGLQRVNRNPSKTISLNCEGKGWPSTINCSWKKSAAGVWQIEASIIGELPVKFSYQGSM